MRPLPKKLKSKPFTAAQLKQAGFSFYELTQLVKARAVEQLGRGIYRSMGGDIDEEEQFRVATLRVGNPSAICLISALSFHHLTDIIPNKTWIMVPDSKRTEDRKIRLYRAANPKWNIEIERHDGYSVTTIERTIVDCLIHRSQLGPQVGAEALREAVRSKKTSLSKVWDVSRKLDVGHRIRPYIEALG